MNYLAKISRKTVVALMATLTLTVTLSVERSASAQSMLDLIKPITEVVQKSTEPGALTTASTTGKSMTPGQGALLQSPGVQMVLTRSKPRSWDDAQKNAINQVSDGDSLWLFIKTEKPLKHYVLYDLDRRGVSSDIMLAIAPKGKIQSASDADRARTSHWPLRVSELNGTEVIISLAAAARRAFVRDGEKGNNVRSGAADFFLQFVAGQDASRGVWENEIVVFGMHNETVPLATIALTVNLANGFPKYRELAREDCQVDWTGLDKRRPCKVVL